MELSKDQTEKLKTILWLTDPLGSRGSGRTQLLALAYIHHSMQYRYWVSILNHCNNHPMANKELLDRIVSIVDSIGGCTLKIKRGYGLMPSILVKKDYKS